MLGKSHLLNKSLGVRRPNQNGDQEIKITVSKLGVEEVLKDVKLHCVSHYVVLEKQLQSSPA